MANINFNEFQAGQGVSAPALNENFALANSAIENLEVELNSTKVSISSISNLKANKNGSSAEKFNVADATEDNNAVSFKQFNDVVETLSPTGTVIWFAGASAPAGYLLCDGSAVSRTVYANLFSVIGVTYGAGDSTTTFELPKLTDDRFAKGALIAGVYQDSNIAAHTHDVNYSAAVTSSSRYAAGGDIGYAWAIAQTATSETFGEGEHTYPKNLSLLPCIKY